MADETTPEQQEIINQLLDKARESLKEQVKLQAEVSRLNGEHITQAEQLANQYKEELRLQQELNEIISATSDKSAQMVDTYKNQLFEAQRVGRITLNNYNNQIALLDEIKSLQEERTRLVSEGTDEARAELKALNQRLELVRENVQEQQRLTAAMNDGVRAGAGLVESMGSLIKLTPDLDQGIVGSLIRSRSETGSFDAAIQGAVSSLGEMLDFGNLFSFFISNTTELTVRMDMLTTSFVKTTGASRDFNNEMVATFRQASQLGIGLQDASEAFQDLFVNFTKFSTLAPQTRVQLAATAAGLEKLGVDTRTTGDSFDFLVSGLGMAVSEAESVLKRFAVEGRQAGIPPQVLAQQFTALEPKLAAFGRQAPEIFMRTAKTAKSLGLEVGELGQNLFSLSEGLDTFDQAADKVASFNLVMGGSFVNTFDLVMAAAEGPFAQLEMLRSGFDAAGKSFENMNFFEQKMLADSFGISIGNLRAMMEGTLSPQEAMVSQEEQFANMVSEASSAVDKLSAGVEQLAAFFAPLSEFMNSVAGQFAAVGAGISAVVAGISGLMKLKAFYTTTGSGLQAIGAAMGFTTAQTVASTAATEANTSSIVRNVAAQEAKYVFDQKTMSMVPMQTAAQTSLNASMAAAAPSGAAGSAGIASTGAASAAATVPVTTLSGAFKALATSMFPIIAIGAAIYGAFSLFGEISDFINGANNETRLFGMTLGGVVGALAGFAAGGPIGALAGFGVGVAAAGAAIPKPQKTTPVGQIGLTELSTGNIVTSLTGQTGIQMPATSTTPQSFRVGGDNITSSFIAGEGPSPRGEFVQPMSVIRAQESGNLATTLKETANALRDTRKSDGTFERMVQVLEKIAGNTEQPTDQRPIEVGLNIGGRQFQKEVVRAMNRELG